MKKANYLEYIKKAVEYGRANYESQIENWRRNFDPNFYFGYMAPSHIPFHAHLEGFLYYLTGDLEHALWCKKALLDMDDLKSIFPKEKIGLHPEYEEGLPAMDALFPLPAYIHGYMAVKDSGVLNDGEKKRIEETIKGSIRSTLHFPEWGAHNRSMLRVRSMALAVDVLECDPETKGWLKYAKLLAQESRGRWSIEDTGHYISLWLHASIHYAKAIGEEDKFYRLPQTKWYFDYMAKLITPYGQVPDFGDTHFNSNWYLWLECLEKGASVYQCPVMKFAASKIWEFAMEIASQTDTISYSPVVASHLAFCYENMDDDIVPVMPDTKSELLLDDLVGKKLAFRRGWEPSDTYMLVNYCDEGRYAKMARQYLRTTLTVRAEKMHHGHNDENSVSLLVRNKNILLCDGGYRERLPNGKYRADLYHNRLVFRKGIMDEQKGVYDFLHDAGHYKHTTTELLYFQDFERLCFSRTRMREEITDITWDRCITYLKEDDVFIVLDYMKVQKPGDWTVANLWHTGKILDEGEKGYDTCIPVIFRGPGDKTPYRNRDDWSLWMEFPDSNQRKTVEKIQRNYGDSYLISRSVSRRFEEMDSEIFVTVLTPHERKKSSLSLSDRVKIELVSDQKDSVLLSYQGKNKIYMTFKLDLDKGISDDLDRYPRYSPEEGRIEYNEIATDADFSYVEIKDQDTGFGLVNGTGIEYKGKTLFLVPSFTTYSFTSPDWKITKNKCKAWEEPLK